MSLASYQTAPPRVRFGSRKYQCSFEKPAFRSFYPFIRRRRGHCQLTRFRSRRRPRPSFSPRAVQPCTAKIQTSAYQQTPYGLRHSLGNPAAGGAVYLSDVSGIVADHNIEKLLSMWPAQGPNGSFQVVEQTFLSSWQLESCLRVLVQLKRGTRRRSP